MQDTLLTYETKRTYNKKALATLAIVGTVCGALAIFASVGYQKPAQNEALVSFLGDDNQVREALVSFGIEEASI
jgi:hypothetical protein